jgi:hypothetical protein
MIQILGSCHSTGRSSEKAFYDGVSLYMGHCYKGQAYIVGNGDGSQISKKRDEDNKFYAEGLVQDDHGCYKVDFEMETQGDTVLDICLHALKDLSCCLNGEDDGTKTGCKENDISGGLGGFRGAFDGNTAIGFLKRWSIVDTYTVESVYTSVSCRGAVSLPSPVIAVRCPRC